MGNYCIGIESQAQTKSHNHSNWAVLFLRQQLFALLFNSFWDWAIQRKQVWMATVRGVKLYCFVFYVKRQRRTEFLSQLIVVEQNKDFIVFLFAKTSLVGWTLIEEMNIHTFGFKKINKLNEALQSLINLNNGIKN